MTDKRPAPPNPRLWDDSIFIPHGTPRPAPNSLGQLLVNLGVSMADDKTRRAAAREWLATNTPSAPLVRSIQRRGYGDLLDSPPETITRADETPSADTDPGDDRP